MSLADLTAIALSQGYASGDLSPEQVAESVTQRIDEREPQLNALWIRDDPEQVLAAARASAQRWAEGRQLSALDGVPVTLKENIARAGLPMPAGCAGVTPVIPTADAPITRRVKEAGMVIVGSTTMPDWGMLSSGHSSLHGLTRSPLNPRWSTGGSSSGAGAAAAAGYGPLHLGSDIGGSIRLPGTWLGLATLKTSAGRLPLHAPYLGRVAGPMARTAADCAALMAVLSGPDLVDWTSLPSQDLDWAGSPADVPGKKVGVWRTAGYGVEAEPEILATVDRVAAALSDAGAELIEINPWLTQDLLDGVDRFWRVRSLNDLEKLTPEAQSRVLPYIVDWVRSAEGLSALDLMEAYAAFGQVQARTMAMWSGAAEGGLDLLISPVAPCAAPPADQPMPYPDNGRGMWHINYTMPWNMTGQPAGTVDAGQMPDGRPIGVQIVGRPFADDEVLRAMAWWESVRG